VASRWIGRVHWLRHWTTEAVGASAQFSVLWNFFDAHIIRIISSPQRDILPVRSLSPD
jgi:hypothetical protein